MRHLESKDNALTCFVETLTVIVGCIALVSLKDLVYGLTKKSEESCVFSGVSKETFQINGVPVVSKKPQETYNSKNYT